MNRGREGWNNGEKKGWREKGRDEERETGIGCSGE